MKTSDIAVSIICNTYNHENYIYDTIMSFINQKTKYPFEILVHDDSSTDNTTKIIKEIEKKYPTIVKPIYQAKNQFSKGVSITFDIQLNRAKGKYIAFCEGDDCWTDNDKLEECITFLEDNPSYSAVFHNTEYYNLSSNKTATLGINDYMDSNYSFVDAINNKCHTSSFVIKKEALILKKPRYFFSFWPVEDWPIKIYLTDNYKVRYIAKTMSLYRCESGSHSFSSKLNDSVFLKKVLKNNIKFLMLVYRECKKENKKTCKELRDLLCWKFFREYGFCSFMNIKYQSICCLLVFKKINSKLLVFFHHQ